MDLLVMGGAVLTLDSQYRIYDPGYVAISGDAIHSVGPVEEGKRFTAAKTLDASGRVVLPGLINGHQHAPMSLLRGLADDLKLMDWLQNYIFPAEAAHVDKEFVYWGTLLSAVEMVSSGTTTYADMYYFENEVAEATARVGMRGVLGETILDFPAPDNQTVGVALEYTEAFIQKWKGHELITPAVAPHAPYTCSRETLLAAKALAAKHKAPLLIHLAEDYSEVEQVRERTGLTPVRYMREIGLLSDRLVAAHVVWADSEEIALLKQFGVGVIHCPESNMKLAAGVAPVPEMLAAGVDVGLGTDGPASNNNLDLFEEMDTMAKLHKLSSKDPTVTTARQVLTVATRGGAQALGLGATVGSLEAGKKADLVIVSRQSAAAVPSQDLYSLVVYSLKGSSVETVIIGGKTVLSRGRFPHLNLHEIYRRAGAFREKVLQSLKANRAKSQG